MLLASLPRLFARHGLCFCASLIASAAALFAQSPSSIDGFDPDVDGVVLSLVLQPDGKVLVAGQFSTVRGVPRSNLARLLPDGSLDAAFNPNPNGPVRAVVLQADNRIVVGGDFTTLQPNATGTAANRGRVARLNADGSLDATYNPNVSGDLLPQVTSLLLQPDGRVVVGGYFTRVQPTGAAAAVTRNNLARFNADGSLDASFNPNPNAMVLTLAFHVDNKIVVGGGFTSFQPAGDSAPTFRNRIARLNASGTVDSEFNPNADNGVTALAVQRDGKILLGGFFTTLQPVGDTSPANRVHLARLNVDGTLDSEFYPRVDGNVAAVAVQPDGAILVGGDFNSVWGLGTIQSNRSFIARFNRDGSLDNAFAPQVNAPVDAFATQADGKILVGGHFTRALAPGATTPLARNHLARLNGDGSIDTSFELDAGGRVLAAVTQTDGRVVIAGTFTSVSGATHNYVARLNADGTVDSSYNPDFNGRVYALVLQPDGKVIVGGAFTTIGGETRNRLARLNPSGTIDSEFNPHFDGQVGSVALQSDGRIIVGGSFTSVTPAGTTTATNRANLLRLNANGSLDTTFDPSPNSSVSAIAVQSDGKIVIGGLFSTLTPGVVANTSATITSRNFLARLNGDGTLDTTFVPNPNAQVSTIAIQADGKVVVGGVFTLFQAASATTSTSRNRIARINADGTLDTTYDPNANGNVLASALQSDGKLIIGGSFTTLTPNGATNFTLRKYAARLNTDGTVDATYNLDISELPGNRVDSLRLQADGRLLIGGSFTSLQPIGNATRIARRNFARLAANGTVDTTFTPDTGGSTGSVVNAFAVQPDGRVIAVGNFADLGGAKSTNIARFRPEGTADTSFSSTLATDGTVNAVIVRPNGAPVPTQTPGFAWLNANGTLRTAFSTSTRLSGEVNAIAVQPNGAVILGGAFANLSNTTGGNLIRLSATGVIDTAFNPAPNGAVSSIAIQSDGKVVLAGSFSLVYGVARNRIARLNADGSLDTGFDPNASAKVNSVVIQSDGKIVIAGTFTTLTPNGTTTAVTANYIARLNTDGTQDSTYNPSPNFNVNIITLQGDGKIVAGGSFTSVAPNGAVDVVTRNGVARFNTDGSLDQNFNPNTNGAVNAIVPLANGQFVLGGSFSTVQPNATGTVFTRNNLARVNSDGAVDASYNPNPNGVVNTLALQADGAVLAGGTFTTLQPGATGVVVTRPRLARINTDGSLDLNFNPALGGSITSLVPRPDGTVLVGGNFSDLQLNGSIFIGGTFATVGGIPARNLASLNDDGSVSTTFQPRPDGAVNAMLVQADGRVVVGGAFTNISGATRNRLARYNTDGSLDATFTPDVGAAVNALALQGDGKILVGLSTGSGTPPRTVVRLNVNGSVDATFTGPASAAGATENVTGLAVQRDDRVLVMTRTQIPGNAVYRLSRLNGDGSNDASFNAVTLNGVTTRASFALQADAKIIVSGQFSTVVNAIGSSAIANLARLNADGTLDASFNPAPNGAVTAVALQSDGRVVVGGGFTNIGGLSRVGIARLAATATATQILGVAANRTAVIWSRAGTTGEINSVIFEQSSDRQTWTRLGDGRRVANSGADWQLAGVNLPATGVFYIRARGLSPSSAGTSSGIFESVREFTFANPVVGAASVIAQTPAQAAAPALVLDPVTGIAPRSRISIVAGEGSVEIFATPTSTPVEGTASRLANLSTRGRVSSTSPLILGFAISGTESRSVLVRAVGPALTGFGVTDALPATRLQVYDATGALIAANEGWANASTLVQAAASTGAFPLRSGSADSAALLNLAPGTYTIQVVDPRGNGGVALAEIYDAGTGTGSQLVNVSSRGAAGTGANALISGFVLAGDASQRVLLRGVGPGLTQFGTLGVVTDPSIMLFDAEGRELGSNDNWVSSVNQVSTATAGAGAFALLAGSKDAAVIANLPAGTYTIQVSAPTTGAALLEIYSIR
ncbi:hypothetical protein [Horticoccus sp. 23ND18S-11]|uniref:hypothetical protein n=1 Tax=Horticoccus sp. 23ND18S-11 TaxID=3391832 RepID=UPI0039C9D54E